MMSRLMSSLWGRLTDSSGDGKVLVEALPFS